MNKRWPQNRGCDTVHGNCINCINFETSQAVFCHSPQITSVSLTPRSSSDAIRFDAEINPDRNPDDTVRRRCLTNAERFRVIRCQYWNCPVNIGIFLNVFPVERLY
ncbi:hypothetical protein DPMN_161359 [Dreissena polymorpha]|uniref:Uncharacterized protein n=1 Tax=Dreissena polymorpha TaxID=45954 RepID=A0A9D4EPI1_DREPO|nr:hypothetical protein DPMN_161359 [Dreissena polymorpha]